VHSYVGVLSYSTETQPIMESSNDVILLEPIEQVSKEVTVHESIENICKFNNVCALGMHVPNPFM